MRNEQKNRCPDQGHQDQRDVLTRHVEDIENHKFTQSKLGALFIYSEGDN